ncbi:protein masquerade [Caerostris extrusa]|uniref:Protein masquerade n=1 Tax=Caerostris extrusa TaxID=172846 RepID=A0AAV4WQZ9_CAEEX|nr:protein masquerade [Caerostris extrusa]
MLKTIYISNHPQIPLIRPGSQQQGYPNIPLGNPNYGPQKNQQPASPFIHKYRKISFQEKPVPPVRVQHIPNQANANQGYVGAGQTGYGLLPQMPHHGNNGYVNPARKPLKTTIMGLTIIKISSQTTKH